MTEKVSSQNKRRKVSGACIRTPASLELTGLPIVPIGKTAIEQLREASRKIAEEKKPENPPNEAPAPNITEAPAENSVPSENKSRKKPLKISLYNESSAIPEKELFRTMVMAGIRPRFAVQKCPKCRSEMPEKSVFCMSCGYNFAIKEFIHGVPDKSILWLKTKAFAAILILLLKLPFIFLSLTVSYFLKGMSLLKKIVVSTVSAIIMLMLASLSFYGLYYVWDYRTPYIFDTGGTHISFEWEKQLRQSGPWLKYFEAVKSLKQEKAPYVKFRVHFNSEKDELSGIMNVRKTYTVTVTDIKTGTEICSEEVNITGPTILKQNEMQQQKMISDFLEKAASKACVLKGINTEMQSKDDKDCRIFR